MITNVIINFVKFSTYHSIKDNHDIKKYIPVRSVTFS